MATMLKLVVLLFCFGLVVSGAKRRDASGSCKNYKTHIRPLIEAGDISGLQEAFKVMNDKKRAVQTFRLSPIDDSIWPETTAIKMLVSLSKPLVETIATADRWPENNNIKLATTGALQAFRPSTSFHGGIRYIYNCATLQEKACFKKGCMYDPASPILVAKRNEDIYVPLENFVAANGDAMSNHIDETNDRTYMIRGFSKLSVRECSARQVFFNGTASADDCFDTLKFFSLPEALESRSMPEDDAAYDTSRSRKTGEPRRRLIVKKAFFAVMS